MLTEEKVYEKYWENIAEKTNSVIEILKGVSYQEIQHILESVESSIKTQIQNSIVY